MKARRSKIKKFNNETRVLSYIKGDQFLKNNDEEAMSPRLLYSRLRQKPTSVVHNKGRQVGQKYDYIFLSYLIEKYLSEAIIDNLPNEKRYLNSSMQEYEIKDWLIPLDRMSVEPEPIIQLPSGRFLGKFNRNIPACKSIQDYDDIQSRVKDMKSNKAVSKPHDKRSKTSKLFFTPQQSI